MYIEYTPVELFDKAEQHLQYPVPTTTTSFGVVESGGNDTDIVENGGSDSSESISTVENNSFAFRKCRKHYKENEYNINQNGVGNCNDNSSIPMGFDILSKIRNLFSDIDGFGRKRRAETDGSTSHFKYRRVESEFPKFIKRSFDEDAELNIVPQRLHKVPMVMADQNQKKKKSEFLPPKTTTKHIKNRNFADIEFSDEEDDDEIIVTNSRGESFNVLRQQNLSRPAIARPNVLVPMSSSKMANIPFKSRQPPPPLIQARTGNILASTLMPELQPIRQQAYSILSTNGFDNPFTNNLGRKGSIPKERIVPIQRSSSILYNGNTMSNAAFKGTRSIIAEEYLSKERDQYKELLQNLAPNLYGIKGTSPKVTPRVKVLPSLRQTKAAPTIDLTAASSSRRKSLEENLLTFDLLDDEDDDVSEIIDLAEDELNMISACSKLQQDQAECSYDVKKRAAEKKYQLPYVEPVNSLKEKFDLSPICKNDWLENFQSKWEKKRLERKKELAETEKEVQELSAETRHKEKEMQERLKELKIVDPDLVVIDDFPEEEEEPEFPEFTPQHEDIIKSALYSGPPDQMLVSKFNMSITRRDISTLMGKNWLNDEVINFYMNLLTERGELRHEEGLPKVYAMNTFFVPRLMQSGHSGVRRWTRKVDIFTYDVIPVPVHVGGVHWCMAIIHIRDRSIKYYDSMGTPNPKILAALEQYLRDESMDKRKKSFDTSGFLIESVKDVPRQFNGSDCGVFSCMFAEYISRDREITFSQQHMDYFRHKMVLEIVQGKLMQ